MTTTWDHRGVPAISAESDEGICREFGRAQAVAHAREVLELYGVARGDAASRWGRAFVAGDIEHAQLLLDDQVDSWCDAQLPETWARIEAFCEGFTAAFDSDPALGEGRRDVLPVRPRDVIAHSVKLFLAFARFWDGGKAFPAAPGGLLGGGSNGWAVSAERSGTGEALLVINPHIPWSGPLRLFEARTVSPGRSCHGITTLGLPWQVMGYGPSAGWTHTVNPIPSEWVYELDIVGDAYRFDGALLPFERRRHCVSVQGGDDEIVESRQSVHGPVVTAPDGVDVAVRVAGVLHRPAYTALEAWWQMSLAESVEAILDAQDRFPLPTFNIIAADRNGSIAAAFCGTAPHRPGGSFAASRHRRPGDDPAELWDEVNPSTSLPRVVNPAGGWVQNVNDTPWWFCEPALDPMDFPDGIAPEPDQLRDIRSPLSRDHLGRAGDIGPARLLALKWQTHVHLADIVLDDLLTAGADHPDLAAACDSLRDWDRTADASSTGYPLFHLWANDHFSTSELLIDSAELTPSHTAGGLPTGLAAPREAVESLRRAAATLTEQGHALDVSLGDFASIPDGSASEPATGGPTFFGLFKCLEYASSPESRPAIGGDSWISLVRFTSDGAEADALLVYDNATEKTAEPLASQVTAYARDQLMPLEPLQRARRSDDDEDRG